MPKQTDPDPTLSSTGFTFIEVLATVLLVSMLAVGMLQAMVLALHAYTATGDHWKATLELWNQSNQFLAGKISGTSSLQPSLESQGLDRIILEDESEKTGIRWEVLRAQQ